MSSSIVKSIFDCCLIMCVNSLTNSFSLFQIKAGFIMDVLSVSILTLGVNTWGASYFDLNTLPAEFMAGTTTTSFNITTTL